MTNTVKCTKVRQIASTLLRKPIDSQTATSLLDYDMIQHYLDGFIDILNKLDRLGPSLTESTSPDSVDGSGWFRGESRLTAEEVEERELIEWASLRDYQENFTKQTAAALDF